MDCLSSGDSPIIGQPEEPEDEYTVIELAGEMDAFCAPSPDGDEVCSPHASKNKKNLSLQKYRFGIEFAVLPFVSFCRPPSL